MNTEKVVIFDTTLRDGEQAPGASMTINEKMKIAHQLARLNVDVIEAGFPVSSPAQFEEVQRIVQEIQGPVICALARAVEIDVRAAGEALAAGTNTRIRLRACSTSLALRTSAASKRAMSASASSH